MFIFKNTHFAKYFRKYVFFKRDKYIYHFKKNYSIRNNIFNNSMRRLIINHFSTF